MKYEAEISVIDRGYRFSKKIIVSKKVISADNAFQFIIEKEKWQNDTFYMDKDFSYKSGDYEIYRKCKINCLCVNRIYFTNELDNEIEKYYKHKFKKKDVLEYAKIDYTDMLILNMKNCGEFLEVKAPKNSEKFYNKLKKLYNYPVKTLYHGTSIKNAKSILSNGFKKSKGGALGPGLYVGPLSKARCFTKRYGEHYPCIFELDVILGNMLTLVSRTETPSQIPEEYDSMYCTYFNQDEYLLKETDQVLIRRVLFNEK